MWWLGLAVAHATDVDLFDPAATLPAGTGTLQGEAPFAGPPGGTAGVLASYAADPVVREFADGTEEPAVEALVPIVLQGGYAKGDRFRIDAALPIYGWVDAPVVEFDGAAVGDLRLQGTIGLWTDGTTGFALVPRINLPTGTDAALVGTGLAGTLLASVGGSGERLGWLANGGIHLTEGSAIEPTSAAMGSRLEAVAGGWWIPAGVVRLGVEVDGDIGLAAGAGGANHTAAAHLFAQQILNNGLGFTAGAGTGLVAGVGTPTYRLIAGVSWTAPKKDQALEPVVAVVEHEVVEPPPILPPLLPPPLPLADRDGDGVTDDVDRCPHEPAPPDEEGSDGCPKSVYVTRTEVRIDQIIEFETGKSALSPTSAVILAEVARVLIGAPWVDNVEVQGHTDSVGDEALNQRLSQARAESVVAALVAAGVPSEKLLARGYGETRPMFTNKTPGGRLGNRRVQFVVLSSEPVTSPTPPQPPPAAPARDAPPSDAPLPALVPVDPANPGSLTVKVYGGEWATVFVDGRQLVKSAPFEDHPIASGSHLLRAENGRLKLVWETMVTIRPGEELVVVVPLPDDGPAFVP